MSDFLSGPLVTFAICWRLERRDGVAIGFTNHDRDLVMDGFHYRSAPGIAPSAIEQTDALAADGPDIAGALTSDAIRETDLLAGRWDGARVVLFVVDWTDTGRRVQLVRGELGSVSIERGSFKAELAGPGAALNRPVAEETSPMCRAALGDRRCRVDLARRNTVARVMSASEDVLELDVSESLANGWGNGSIVWLDGANAGLRGIVRLSDGAQVSLDEPPHLEVEAGTRVRIIQGCDKRFATCRDRFDNALNFRGEPHLPGMDLLTRYPGE